MRRQPDERNPVLRRKSFIELVVPDIHLMPDARCHHCADARCTLPAAIAVLGIYFKRAAIMAAAAATATATVAAKAAAAAAEAARPAPAVALTPVVPAAPVPPVAAEQPAEAAPLVAPDMTPELVAVIAAAVQLTLRDAYRIHAIVPVAGHDWAHEGRRQIFASHQIR